MIGDHDPTSIEYGIGMIAIILRLLLSEAG